MASSFCALRTTGPAWRNTITTLTRSGRSIARHWASSPTDQECRQMPLDVNRIHDVPADVLAAIDYCYEQGWTDGLPVVPPVVERVHAMLAYEGRPHEAVIATHPATTLQLTVHAAADCLRWLCRCDRHERRRQPVRAGQPRERHDRARNAADPAQRVPDDPGH